MLGIFRGRSSHLVAGRLRYPKDNRPGTEMLYKRPDSQFWWVSITDPNGRKIRRSTGTPDKKAAEEYLAKLTIDLFRQSRLGEKPRHTWQEAVLRWAEEKGHKASFADDLRHLAVLDDLLRDKYLDEISLDIIKTISAKRRSGAMTANKPGRYKPTVSNATTNRTLALLRGILRAAERQWGWLDRAPAVTLLPEPNKRVRWLTEEEAQRLLAELPPHLADMAAFTLATGLRASNVLNLLWENVDLERRIAWIHGDESKSGKAIGVALNRDAILILRKQIGKHSSHVFCYQRPSGCFPVKECNSAAWYKALERAGISDFRWHDLRHTWASRHVQAGTPLHVLQELGGWSSIGMVQRYAHLSAEHLADHAERITKKLEVVRDQNVTKGDGSRRTRGGS